MQDRQVVDFGADGFGDFERRVFTCIGQQHHERFAPEAGREIAFPERDFAQRARDPRQTQISCVMTIARVVGCKAIDIT